MLLKKLSVMGLVAVFSFAMVGMAMADSASDYTSQSDCSDAGYYWYSSTETCYETENAKLSAQVSHLLDRIEDLTATINELSGGDDTEEPATGGDVPAECEGVEFNRSLSVGMEGQDVKCLQVMLNQDLDEPIADSGPGSPGKETSYFGSITKAGVVRFQERYRARVLAPIGLSSGTGYFGQRTRLRARERLNEMNWERKRKQERDQDQEQSEELTYCETDEDCVLVDSNCCGCSSSGGKKCINKEYEESWVSELNCEEKESIACPMVYLCDDLPSGCECVDNTCQTIE